MARPAALDEQKRREVCALVNAGMPLRHAAEHVGCHVRTVERARQTDDDFNEQMRLAQMAASVTPLQAMRRAAATHWRAAAWMLEREDQRYRERDREAERREREQRTGPLAEQVKQAVWLEVACPLTRVRLEARIDAVFAGDSAQQVRGLPQAAAGAGSIAALLPEWGFAGDALRAEEGEEDDDDDAEPAAENLDGGGFVAPARNA